MKKLFAIISLFALVLTSCEKEETIVIGSNFDTITATIESAADTRATLQTTGAGQGVPVKWKDNDEISVFFNDGGVFKNVLYRLNSGDNTTEGIFQKGTNEPLGGNATIVAAVYPYNANATYTDGTINVPPTEIIGQSNVNIINAGPMAAKANGTSNSLEFKNVGAYVSVTVVNSIPEGYTSVELSSETSNLSGAYSLEFDNNGIPTAELTGNNNTITYSGNSVIGDETIYFPVFAGTYSDLKVTAKGTSKPDITLIAPKALTAVRNTIHYTSREVESYSTNTVELETNGGKELSIVIESDEKTITVKEKNGNNVTGNVNILINEGSLAQAQDQTRDLIINLPQATVLLSGDTEYTSITSTTASNTLILGKGVTAQVVTVNKGNVQVNEEATVIQFVNGSAEDIVIIDNGGTIPTGNTGFIERKYAEHELIKAISDNTVNIHTLTGNVTLSEILTIDKNFVLDGNGFTLTSTANRAINIDCNDEVIIKNLTINTTSSSYSNSNTERAINVIQKPVTLTLDNVNATGFKYTINVAKSSEDSKITISGGVYSGYAAMNITGNGTEVKATGVTFNGRNDATLNEWNNYAVISIGDAQDSDVTANVKLEITDGTLSASSTNGNRQAAIQLSDATNVDISVDAELSLCGNFVLFNELSAGTVSFRNEYEDELIAQGYITTAADNNMFDVSFVPVSNAEDLRTAVTNGGNVVLLGDITLSELVSINAPTYLNLNNKTVTANCKKAFEVHADATIYYGKIVSQQRCVDTRKAVKLTLYDLDLESKDYYSAHGNQQPLTIGGSTDGTIVTLTDVNIDAGKTGYCIISFVETDLDATNCTLTGYSAYYAQEGSQDSTFDFNNCSLTGDCTNNDVEENSFSVIAIQTSNVTVNVNGGSVIAKGDNMFAISIGSETVTGLTNNAITVKGATITGNILDLTDDDLDNNNVKIPDNETYKTWINNAGFGHTQNNDGTITIIKLNQASE